MGEGSATLGFGRRGRPRGVDAVASPLRALRPLLAACDGLGESARSLGRNPSLEFREALESCFPTADHAGGASGAVVSSALNIRRFVSLSPTLCGVWQRRSGTFSYRSRGDPVEDIRSSPRNAGPVQLIFYPVALRLTGNSIANLKLARSLVAWNAIRRRRLLGSRRSEKPARGFVVAVGEGAVEAPGHDLRDRPATSALAIKSKLGR